MCMFLPFIDAPEIDVIGYLNILVTCFILECVCYLRPCINTELLNYAILLFNGFALLCLECMQLHV